MRAACFYNLVPNHQNTHVTTIVLAARAIPMISTIATAVLFMIFEVIVYHIQFPDVSFRAVEQ